MIEIEIEDLIDLIHWARRYCDGRRTFAPSTFNNVYNKIKLLHREILESEDSLDETLMDGGRYFPYAQDAMYNEETGAYNAIPTTYDKG